MTSTNAGEENGLYETTLRGLKTSHESALPDLLGTKGLTEQLLNILNEVIAATTASESERAQGCSAQLVSRHALWCRQFAPLSLLWQSDVECITHIFLLLLKEFVHDFKNMRSSGQQAHLGEFSHPAESFGTFGFHLLRNTRSQAKTNFPTKAQEQ